MAAPLVRKSADYSKFCEAIRDDQSLLSETKSYYAALYTRRVADSELEDVQARTPGSYTKARLGGATHEETVASVRLLFQNATRFYLRAAHKEILDNLNRIETRYFRKLERSKRSSIVTYRALTRRDIQNRREKSDRLLRELRQATSDAPVDTLGFRQTVVGYLKELNSLKDLACQLADQASTWDKINEDRLRLYVAVAGLALAVFSLAVVKIFEILHRPPSVVAPKLVKCQVLGKQITCKLA